MKTIYALVRNLALFAGIFVLASCAQLPPHISIANKTSVTGKAATFAQCKMSVRFTGGPRTVSSMELSPLMATPFFKWEVDALAYDQYRLSEGAVCLCRDVPFSTSEIDQAESIMRANKDFKIIRTHNTQHSKKVIELELSAPNGLVNRGHLFYPTAAPSCFMILSVMSERAASSPAPAFFDTVEVPQALLTGTVGSPLKSEAPQPATTHRLQELGNLLRERLITQEEYDQKRRAILENL